MKKENWNIIAKHLSDEDLNQEELSYLDEAHTNEEMKILIDESASTLKQVNRFYELKKINTDYAWNRIDSQLSKSKRIVPLPKSLLQFAAIFLFIVATSLIALKVVSSLNTIEFETAKTDISRPQFTLPDGTAVTLNHGSKLSYPKNFKGDKRIVSLQGEAFFDVSPNKDKPFIILTQKASVKVLGTSFNVYAYKNKESVEVTVETGKVELRNTIEEAVELDKVLLLPGDKGTLNTTTGALQKMSPKKTNSLSWITRDIEFELSNLQEVVSTLEHIYSLSIKLDDQVDPNQIITASFNKQDPEYIIDVVALTLSLEVSNTGEHAYYIKNK